MYKQVYFFNTVVETTEEEELCGHGEYDRVHTDDKCANKFLSECCQVSGLVSE